MNLDTLITKTITGAAPCIVGLDVSSRELPSVFLKNDETEADAVRAYNRAVIDAVCDKVSGIAVNMSVLLPYGVDVVSDAIAYAKEKGLYTIADAKCIGEPTASRAEAEFYFDKLDADCITVSAYYGASGLAPFFEKSAESGKGVFVLSHTASGSPQDVQELMAGLRPVYRAICEKINIWGEKRIGSMGYSDIGIMIGGIPNSTLREMRRTYKKSLFLITGYDGEKTTAHDINGAFDMRGLGGLVYVTRTITLPGDEGDFCENVKLAAENVCRDLRLCF
ncbi:MAG: orotidine-5'-phosphate decarboxylase [Oscillospiraceae bacterium]|nr:orotidine-5'-phosphate decarboxylase [Oscillospiraceae bacterium]